MSVGQALARVPVRLRLTLAFAVVMAALLSATGLFLYLRLGSALDRTIDQSLRSRADDVAALVGQNDAGLWEGGGNRLADQRERFAQVLESSGTVADATPELGDRPLLTEEQLARASRTTTWVERATIPGSDDPIRLLATPVQARGASYVVVVGASLEGRADALESLLTQLLIGGPVALVLSSLAAYGLAAAALQPVESMRREAEAVSAAEPGRRLPLSPARDEIARLAQTLNTMLARLESALTRERRFVSDASHELRTPLAALRAELDLALARNRTPEELEGALRSAAEETERLSQLAQDLLVLARADDGKLPVRRERLAAAGLLADLRQRYARRAVDANRTLEVDTDDHLELSVDRLRTEQALGNLVENALRHGDGRILLQAHRRDGRIELHVRDEGPGFDTSSLPDPTDPANLERRSGRGLLLMRAFLSEVRYNDRGNEVMLVRRTT